MLSWQGMTGPGSGVAPNEETLLTEATPTGIDCRLDLQFRNIVWFPPPIQKVRHEVSVEQYVARGISRCGSSSR